MRSARSRIRVEWLLAVAALLLVGLGDTPASASPAADGIVPGGGVVRVNVPAAIGGKTVIGQLTAARVTERGYVTAYPCDDGTPRHSDDDADGDISRSDLNYNGQVQPVTSNRLVVEADDNGDICLYTSGDAALVIDINGVTFDTGITSFPNQRTDTRRRADPYVDAGDHLRINVPAAIGGKTVIGQLTAARVTERGYVTAYPCSDGIPRHSNGDISRSDLNYNGQVQPVTSNRLVVEADDNGDICLYTSGDAALVIDINGVSDTGITSFPNQRTDTRAASSSPTGAVTIDGVPVWPPYAPQGPLDGTAALTGLPADSATTSRPVLAVKIDNYRRARPQWGLHRADVVIEENVEGVSRFVALFHSRLPTVLGPVRSARTADLDLLAAMNRPVFAYSGSNPGVGAWIDSAARSGVLVEFSAQRRPCFRRTPERPGPHNLLLDPACALGHVETAGPARPLWRSDGSWMRPADMAVTNDNTFAVPMDGVHVEWTWDPGAGRYLRSQDGQPHLAASGERIAARTVVELVSTHVPSPVDARSPNPITTGTGTAVVHRDGVAIAVTWSRSSPYDPFTFIDSATGHDVPLDVGTTFLQLVRKR